jgi:hypothetical protein
MGIFSKRAPSASGTVKVIGRTWEGTDAATVLYLDDEDVYNILDIHGYVSQNRIADWLEEHGGDFAEITDFCGSVDMRGRTTEVDWEDPDSEDFYAECMGADWDGEPF